MPLLTFSNADIQFVQKKLIWRSYTAAKALTTTKQAEFINKKEFVKAVLDKNVEVVVMYVTFLLIMAIRVAKKAQIALLFTEKVKITAKYSDFLDIFSNKKALMLPNLTKINQHAIELQEGKQPPYGPIQSLGPVELKLLKTYIKINRLKILSVYQNHPPVFLSFLFKSQKPASGYA